MRRLWLVAFGLLVCAAGGVRTPAWAWWTAGHAILAKAAVKALPAEVPSFFRSGADMIGHCAWDPDVEKNRAAPQLDDAETPEHYIDYELLKGEPLPPTRSQFVRMCARETLDPKSVGMVPYAIAEYTGRLTIAFAEHRRWPHDPYIPQKCLVYAGFLSHYASDLCQPLHTTVDHDGRAGLDGTSPRSGIHPRVDALIEKLQLKPEELAKEQQITPVTDLMPAILQELQNSHALVGRVYALEPQLPPTRGAWTPSPEIRAFGTERAREATRFIGSLYLTAWQRSAHVTLPLDREAAGE